MSKDIHVVPNLDSGDSQVAVTILAHIVSASGAGTYTSDLYTATKEYSRLINVAFNPASIGKFDYGEVEGGFRNKVLNTIFPRLAFRSVYKEIGKMRSKGMVVHYADQTMVPMSSGGEREVVTIHDDIYLINVDRKRNLTTWLWKRYSSRFLRFANILTSTRFVRDRLLGHGAAGKITVIHHPTHECFKPVEDKMKLRDELGLPKQKKLILSISNSEPHKNLRTVKEVAERLHEQDYSLVRVGEKIGDSITFQSLERQVVAKIYSACDVLLFPSLYEGFGKPVVEAFASGLPVVASNIPPITEISEGAAILCDPLDISGLVGAVKEAMNDKRSWIEKGLERAKEFTFEKFKTRMRDYYGTLMR